ncbi:helix-turn-helix domain-containing protein [Nocardia sp. NPDC051321]|uniref:DprA-like winged helix domain-containing protein n=1 Tax=Nocardia sp. NPDC051321 TaxID=3364323 RepID=UPI00379CC334
MNRRVLLLITAGGAVVLVPWILFVIRALPDGYTTDQWRLAWVGFDVLLLAGLGASAWLGFRRRRAAVPVLIATAALLCCDAWFDVVLDWSSDDRWGSLLLAVGAEIPLGLFLILRARHILAADQPPRVVTAQELRDIFTNPVRQEIMHALTPEPTTVRALAARLDADPAEVAAELRTLEVAGFVRGDEDQWRKRSLDLRWPEPDQISTEDSANFVAWQDQKLAQDLEILANVARHAERYGPWTKCSRGGLLLTPEELGRFFDEYLELLIRYGALRDQAGGGRPGRFREPKDLERITVRFYTFPQTTGEPLTAPSAEHGS